MCIKNHSIYKRNEYWAKTRGQDEKFSDSLRETRNKRLLGRDPDRSWCHRHTCVKLYFPWSQSMNPWTELQHTRMLPPMSMESWAAMSMESCGGDTSSCPCPYPTGAVPSCMSVVGWLEIFTSLSYCKSNRNNLTGRLTDRFFLRIENLETS